VLCGDFNLEANEPEYALLTAAPEDVIQWGQLWDSWRLLNGEVPQPHTFRFYDRRYGPVPICCDFVFVSDALKYKVRAMAIDDVTQVSDHQPVLIELG
jgi:endonuclease/exonuclease/phosphatase family metal-dependent hydrolase